MPSQIHFENPRESRCALRRGKLSIFSFFIILFFCIVKGAVAVPALVQEVASAASGTAISFSLSFPKNTVAGDLIVVGFDFATTTTASSSSANAAASPTRWKAPGSTPGNVTARENEAPPHAAFLEGI